MSTKQLRTLFCVGLFFFSALDLTLLGIQFLISGGDFSVSSYHDGYYYQIYTLIHVLRSLVLTGRIISLVAVALEIFLHRHECRESYTRIIAPLIVFSLCGMIMGSLHLFADIDLELMVMFQLIIQLISNIIYIIGAIALLNKTDKEPDVLTGNSLKEAETMNTVVNEAKMQCPRCGGTNLQLVSEVHGKGASFWKLCFCGLLGLCGTGKTTTDHYWICSGCGNKFKA